MDREMYQKCLGPLMRQISRAEALSLDKEAADIARDLAYRARDFNLNQAEILVGHDFESGIKRNFKNPKTYTNPIIIGKDWADDPLNPLEEGELWNHGRRECNSYITYQLNKDMLPINPYMNYGIEGRVVGAFGPNHAIDIAPIRVQENSRGNKALHVLGIIRKDDKKPALCGGFVKFKKNTHDKYTYKNPVIVETQVGEFFEEIISGSIDLLPDYERGLNKEVELIVEGLAMTRQKSVAEDEVSIIYEEIKARRKFEQVKKEDPEFLERLTHFFEQSTKCYEGPVVSSMRNTNTSWMETRLSTNILDPKTWKNIKGDDKFGYDFVSGDDADDVLWHEVTPELIEKATGSHGSFFSYVLSSYLVDQTKEKEMIDKDIKKQAQELVDYFNKGSGVRSYAYKREYSL